MNYWVIFALLLGFLPHSGMSLTALRCDKTVGDISAVDLTKAGECTQSEKDFSEPEALHVQILYTHEERPIEVKHCTAVVSRYVAYCGGTMTYKHGWLNTVSLKTLKVSKYDCEEAFRSNTLAFDWIAVKGKVKMEVEIGRKRMMSYHRYGGVTTDMGCYNYYEEFKSGDRHVSNVYEQSVGSCQIKMVQGKLDVATGIITTNEPKVKLQYDRGYHFSPEHGSFTWSTVDEDKCDAHNQYLQGIVKVRKKLSEQGSLKGAYFRYEEERDRHYAAFLGEPITYCQRKCYKLQTSTKLIACFTDLSSEKAFPQAKLDVGLLALDKETHVMLSNRGKTDYAVSGLFEVYYDRVNKLESDICELERSHIQASLNSLRHGNLHALDHIIGTNNEVVVSGNLAYVFKCSRVNVTFVPQPGTCFNELPVTVDGDALAEIQYLDTADGKLKKVPTEALCIGGLRQSFYYGGNWNCLNDEGTALITDNCKTPEVINPTLQPGEDDFYKLHSLLAAGGILTDNEIRKLFDFFHHAQYTTVAASLLGDYAMKNSEGSYGPIDDIRDPRSILGMNMLHSIQDMLKDPFGLKGIVEVIILFSGGLTLAVGIFTFFYNLYLASEELKVDQPGRKVAKRFLFRTLHLAAAPFTNATDVIASNQERANKYFDKHEENNSKEQGFDYQRLPNPNPALRKYPSLPCMTDVNVDVFLDEKLTKAMQPLRAYLSKESTSHINSILPSAITRAIDDYKPALIETLKTILLFEMKTSDVVGGYPQAASKEEADTEPEFDLSDSSASESED